MSTRNLNDTTQEFSGVASEPLESLYQREIDIFLANGGSITKCPDGPYEGQLKGWGDPKYGKSGGNVSADMWSSDLTKDRDLDKRTVEDK